MKNNTGDIDKKGVFTKLPRILIPFGILVILLSSFLVWARFKPDQNAYNIQAAIDLEKELSQSHGEEVTWVIENFQSKWDSIEVLQNPELRKELAVSPYVDEFIEPTNDSMNDEIICDTDECLIISSVNVEKVRVLEYSKDRFKAIGCATASIDKVTPKGELIDSLDPYDFTNIYVFVFDNGSWKLSGLYNLSIPQDAIRDWDFTPDWMKQIIGDLPFDNLSCNIGFQE